MGQFDAAKLNATIDSLDSQSKQMARVMDIYSQFVKLSSDFDVLKSVHLEIAGRLSKSAEELTVIKTQSISILENQSVSLDGSIRKVENRISGAIDTLQQADLKRFDQLQQELAKQGDENRNALSELQREVLQRQQEYASKHEKAYEAWRSEAKQQARDLELHLNNKIQELHSDYIVKMRAEGEQIQRGIETKLNEIYARYEISLKDQLLTVKTRQKQMQVMLWLLIAIMIVGLTLGVVFVILR
jgi:hypothetical protein